MPGGGEREMPGRRAGGSVRCPGAAPWGGGTVGGRGAYGSAPGGLRAQPGPGLEGSGSQGRLPTRGVTDGGPING